jgi:hypothetical protein
MKAEDQIERCVAFFEDLKVKIESMLREGLIQVCSNGILPEEIVAQKEEAKKAKN